MQILSTRYLEKELYQNGNLTQHEQIESLAYRLYEDEGRPDGRAEEHWARAEEIIHSQRMAIVASSENLEHSPHTIL